jgi:hypothetical protein
MAHRKRISETDQITLQVSTLDLLKLEHLLNFLEDECSDMAGLDLIALMNWQNFCSPEFSDGNYNL